MNLCQSVTFRQHWHWPGQDCTRTVRLHVQCMHARTRQNLKVHSRIVGTQTQQAWTLAQAPPIMYTCSYAQA